MRTLLMLVAIVLQAASAAIAQPDWPFDPPRDTFDPAAVLDLRSLNEPVAGERGFIRLTTDGRGFAHADGSPVRFWSLNTNPGEKPIAELEEHARFIAKRGVNMVRWHGNLSPRAEGSAITDVNERELDQLFRLVAAMKKSGVYVTASPYWAIPVKPKASWGLADSGAGNATGLLFFDRKLQDGYKAWLRAMLTRPNPYTGIPLAQDPALALVQLQNEDSLLFWTFSGIKGDQLDNLAALFGEFCRTKYGSIPLALKAWDNHRLRGDDPAGGLLYFENLWEYGQPQRGGRAVRLSDQLEFLTTTMRTFNNEMVRYIREELGAPQLINAGNWITANAVTLTDAERYSYTACEVMGVNRYIGGIHKGDKDGWAIENGDFFTSVSCLLEPRELPTNIRQPQGHPFIISESTWVPPNEYQSEGPFLMAVYQSLTGVDRLDWFATKDTQWTQPKSSNGYTTAIGKWVCATPMQMGQFPAAALAFRKGYIKEGEPVVVEHRPLADVWRFRVPAIAESESFDPNRNAGDMAPDSVLKGGVDPLAFLVGPVEVRFGGDPAQSRVVPLSKYIDTDRKRVSSITGEAALDWGKGVCTLAAPRAQGACGFLSKAGEIVLPDVTITCANDYASVMVVAMDDLPLSESKRVLIQIGTQALPTGWKETPASREVDAGDGKQKTVQGAIIAEHGGTPWRIVSARVDLVLRNPGLKSATSLDANGMRTDSVPVERVGSGGLRLRVPGDVLYLVVE